MALSQRDRTSLSQAGQDEIRRATAQYEAARAANDAAGMAAAHRAAEQVLGGVRHREIETALLCSQEEAAVLSTPLAITLAEHGMRHPALAAVLEKRATGDPQSVRLLRAALMASEEQQERGF